MAYDMRQDAEIPIPAPLAEEVDQLTHPRPIDVHAPVKDAVLVVDAGTGAERYMAPDEATEAFRAGAVNLPKDAHVGVADQEGELHELDALGANDAVAAGGALVPRVEAHHAELAREYGGFKGGAIALGAGLGRGATLGLSDAAIHAIGGDDAAEALEASNEAHPYLRAGGEMGGMALSSLALPGGGLGGLAEEGALGLAARATGGAIAKDAAGLGARALARGLGAGVRGFTEGAEFGLQDVVSESALHTHFDATPELTGEQVLANVGHAALLGSLAGSLAGAGSETLATGVRRGLSSEALAKAANSEMWRDINSAQTITKQAMRHVEGGTNALGETARAIGLDDLRLSPEEQLARASEAKSEVANVIENMTKQSGATGSARPVVEAVDSLIKEASRTAGNESTISALQKWRDSFVDTLTQQAKDEGYDFAAANPEGAKLRAWRDLEPSQGISRKVLQRVEGGEKALGETAQKYGINAPGLSPQEQLDLVGKQTDSVGKRIGDLYRASGESGTARPLVEKLDSFIGRLEKVAGTENVVGGLKRYRDSLIEKIGGEVIDANDPIATQLFKEETRLRADGQGAKAKELAALREAKYGPWKKPEIDLDKPVSLGDLWDQRRGLDDLLKWESPRDPEQRVALLREFRAHFKGYLEETGGARFQKEIGALNRDYAHLSYMGEAVEGKVLREMSGSSRVMTGHTEDEMSAAVDRPVPLNHLFEQYRGLEDRLAGSGTTGINGSAAWTSGYGGKNDKTSQLLREFQDKFLDHLSTEGERASPGQFGASFKDLDQKYRKISLIRDSLEVKAARQLTNRRFSLTDSIAQAGGGAGAMTALMAGHPLVAATAMLGGVANKFMRERGPRVAAYVLGHAGGLDGVAGHMQSFGGMLTRAAASAVAANDERSLPERATAARTPDETRGAYETAAGTVRELADHPGLAGAIDEHMADFESAAPKSAAAAKATTKRAVAYLASHLPEPVHLDPLQPSETAPASPGEMSKWLRRYDAVNSPRLLLEQVRTRAIDPLSLEAVQTVYPSIAQRLQREVLENLADGTKIARADRVALAPIAGMAMVPSLEPTRAVASQVSFAAKPAPPAGGNRNGAPSKISEAYPLATASQRVERGD
jgi:hypothetical protein